MSSNSSSGKLIRRLRGVEYFHAVGGLHNDENTVQAVWLTSEVPFQDGMVRESILLLSQKYALLRTCVARHGLSLWLKEMDTIEVDFQIETRGHMDVFYDLLNSSYDMHVGPLWRSRFVRLSETSGIFIFSAQHSITDAFTNMTVCREFVNMLNDIINGINIEIELYPVSSCVMSSVHSVNLLFSAKYFLGKCFRTFFSNFASEISFNGVMSAKEKSFDTKVLFHSFTEEETSKFIFSCKSEGVTINSCLVAAMDIAFFQTAKTFQYKCDSAMLYVSNCVNTRRYYSNKSKTALGCNYSFEEHCVRISTASLDDFWSIAKEVHGKVHCSVEHDLTPLKMSLLFCAGSLVYILNTFTKSGNVTPDCHFWTSNMGDVSEYLKVSNGPVKISDLLRSVKSVKSQTNCIMAAQTFNRKLSVSLDYYLNRMDKDIAYKIFSNFVINLKNVCLK